MMGRTLLRVCFAALGLSVAGAAHSADYDGRLPDDGFSGFLGCLYARVDGGASMYDRPNVIQPIGNGFSSDGAGSYTSTAINPEIDPTGFFEGGLGCQVSSSLRIEVTGGIHLKSSLTDAFTGVDPDTLSADIGSQHVFVSTFWDITNYGGFTPYVGGGIGAARHEISGLTGPLGAADGSQYDFAYHVSIGVAYDITSNLKFDLAYRYIDLGEVISGIDTAPPVGVDSGAMSVDSIQAHEVKVGLRYHFGESTW
ncbi:outer membrane beta-barrel protein [Anderseniella sp. Alg231-50]|uniref:outer membrane beta-barrel protein n=1 Tax=Anderseniella sp. Alg231-50 TaxID=1922226 RepID=UPI000D55E1EE